MGNQSQLPWAYFNLDTPVFLVGQDRRALQRSTQDFTIYANLLVGTDWNHSVIIGETAINQLGRERHVFTPQPQVIAPNLEFNFAIAAIQKALQFENPLPRDNNLPPGIHSSRQGCFAHR